MPVFGRSGIGERGREQVVGGGAAAQATKRGSVAMAAPNIWQNVLKDLPFILRGIVIRGLFLIVQHGLGRLPHH